MKEINFLKMFQPYYCSDLIRVGKDGDGGYLVNKKDVYNTKSLLSFGIGADNLFDVSFEKEFTTLNPVTIHAYDEKKCDKHKDFFIDNKLIYYEKIDGLNIKNIVHNAGDQIFLKCDIDGGEYDILYELLILSNKFTGVVIEFHDIYNFEKFNEFANFVAKFDLRLVHIHVNNYQYFKLNNNSYAPNVVELTFSSSKDNTELKRNITLPHLLDMPNNLNDEDFKIIF